MAEEATTSAYRTLSRGALVVSLLLLGLTSLTALSSLPYKPWNNARLAPSLALTYGYPLYSGPDEGPIEPTLYGPVKALLLLPAALAKSPTGTLLIAGAINQMMFLLPLLVLLRSVGVTARSKIWPTLVGFVFAASCAQLVPPLRFMSTDIHVDAPAVGLGLLSCVVLMSCRGAPRLGRLALAATLVVLAAWTKQIEAPLAMAQIVWIWMAFGRRYAMIFAACLVGTGVAISGLFFAVFGYSEMTFNIFTLVAAHPLDGAWGLIALSALDLLINSSPFLAVLLLALRRRCQQAANDNAVASSVKGWLLDLVSWPGSLLLFAAAFLAPPSVLARSFAGGDQNSFHPLYYLLAAAALVFTQVAAERAETERAPAGRRVLVGLVVVLSVIAVYRSGSPKDLLELFDNPLEQAWSFAREHPGEVYLPWHPLVTLLAEGKLYHFDYAIYDHEIAGHHISRQRFLANTPARLRYVVVEELTFTSEYLRYLPEFSKRTEIADLNEWKVLTRE